MTDFNIHVEYENGNTMHQKRSTAASLRRLMEQVIYEDLEFTRRVTITRSNAHGTTGWSPMGLIKEFAIALETLSEETPDVSYGMHIKPNGLYLECSISSYFSRVSLGWALIEQATNPVVLFETSIRALHANVMNMRRHGVEDHG